jgi:hypothetical protein
VRAGGPTEGLATGLAHRNSKQYSSAARDSAKAVTTKYLLDSRLAALSTTSTLKRVPPGSDAEGTSNARTRPRLEPSPNLWGSWMLTVDTTARVGCAHDTQKERSNAYTSCFCNSMRNCAASLRLMLGGKGKRRSDPLILRNSRSAAAVSLCCFSQPLSPFFQLHPVR